tara:strand:- start:640 stop:849 length:210 start_codon:yes stop_codon:yes gene_type:complete
MSKEEIIEKIEKAQYGILQCHFLNNVTYKQKEKNKDSYYTDLFRAVKQDYDLRDKVNNFIKKKGVIEYV